MSTTEALAQPESASGEKRTYARRVARTSLIGTAIAYYDFTVFGTATAIVFAPQFFPTLSSFAGTLAAFATFGVGFLARPVGGIVMGHLGDRVGRKKILVASLLLMGAGTFLIGVLPNYNTIGIAAPLLLLVLRFVQGFGVGGEWGGAVLIAVENAPPRRRTLYGSFARMGNPIGIIAATLVFLLLGATLAPDQVASWAWRIPFLLSAVLVVYGLIVRLRVQETPEFAQLEKNHEVSRVPLAELVRTHPHTLALTGLAASASPAVGWLSFVDMITYARQTLNLPGRQILWLIVLAAAVWLTLIGPAATWCYKHGQKYMYLGGIALAGLWSVPEP